jgi:hypothetical protein
VKCPAWWVVAALVIIATASLPNASAAINGGASPCRQYDQTTACASFEKIDLTSRRKMSGTTPGTGDGKGKGGRVAEPPGTVRLVSCGVGTSSQLQTLGDPSASIDARGCVSGQAGCDQTVQDTGRPHRNFVRVVKESDGSWSLTGTECDAVAAPLRVTPLAVLERARRLIPAAPIGLAPRGSTLANIQTIMWIDTAEARVLPAVVMLGQPVSIHIGIDHVAWDFGDAHSDTTDGPGTPYEPRARVCITKQCPGYFGHTYTATGQMTVIATVTWRARFRVSGSALTAIPGTIAGPTATVAILVREARSVLVPDPTPH